MPIRQLRHKELSEKIISCAYNVHNELGQGFLEKVYKNALGIELEESGIEHKVETPLKVLYHGLIVGEYSADIIVDNKIIVEVKAVIKINPAHEVQLVNYLKATGVNVGLLINFAKSVEVKRRIYG
jgi:GxxExxY protein